ncbi:hypothetical protein Pan153_39910 [Gimesia panareensis]|uniref:Lipoprotein n=1 Tax=Gimesia panareensis TaxID=2527978 RepID=A0A518FSJ9_9PLAN|nr:hypothetical protein [Gimesia panareensis]QDV19326.1 hypothetical protein Pan153_39910 [Gimesia panareensis]
MRCCITAALLLALSTGCGSIKTTAFDRLEDDTLIANPDQHLKGVPVTLKVPTHLKLTIEEKSFWRVEGSQLVPVATSRITRDVTPEVQYTEKVFLVDPVRPAAGESGYGFTFMSDNSDPQSAEKYSGSGQLKGLNYKITDTTITESASLLAKSLNFVNAFPGTKPKGQKNSAKAFGGGNEEVMELNVIQTTRVVAWSQFDINSEYFEEDVMGFLNKHLNDKSCEPGSPVAANCKQ